MKNLLLFGDNLKWLRDHRQFPDGIVDLVYLDPPFNSNADYNMLFKEASGEESRVQFHAFTDTWHWVDAEATYREFLGSCPVHGVVETMEGVRSFLGTSPVMAYLAMMAPRLVELHRVLKPTGSIYLHCDPTAGHYLKILMDAIFGARNFKNEIIWKRTFAHGSSKRYGPVHDILLFYTKSDRFTWTDPRGEHDPDYIEKHFTQIDQATGRNFAPITLTGSGVRYGESGKPWRGVDPTTSGRHWALPGAIVEELGIDGKTVQEKLDQLDAAGMIAWPEKQGGVPRLKWFADRLRGQALLDVWTDVPPISAHSKERLSYPTQKPLRLLERIIQASSNEGDLVMDPFCGCGTAVHAAQRLGRAWIGIDITYLAINLIKKRLADANFPDLVFEEKGQPQDGGSAARLAEIDKFQFQQWALSLVNALPRKEGEGRGADRGVDGVLFFWESRSERRRILVQVKGGVATRSDVATFLGDVTNQGFAGGILIALKKPTKAMQLEAVEAGRYQSALWSRQDYPVVQILTVEQLIEGSARPITPPLDDPFQKGAPEYLRAEAAPGLFESEGGSKKPRG